MREDCPLFSRDELCLRHPKVRLILRADRRELFCPVCIEQRQTEVELWRSTMVPDIPPGAPGSRAEDSTAGEGQ